MTAPSHNLADGVPGDSSSTSGVVEFRIAGRYFYIGIVCLGCFVVFGTVGGTAALLIIDGSFPRPIIAFFVLSLFWGAWSLLCLWMVAAARKARLYLDYQSLRFEGLFRTKVFSFTEITEARWRIWPAGGSLLLRSASQTLRVEFSMWENSEELLRCLRAAIDPHVQTHWEEFRELREPSPERKEATNKKQRRAMLILSSAFLVYGVFFAAVQQILPRLKPVLYLAALLNLSVGIYFLARFARRKQPTTAADDLSKKD